MASAALTLLVALAGAALAVEPCPAECSCSTGDELEYACDLPSGKLTVTARTRDYVNIDCEGGALTCEEFPYIPLGDNKQLSSLGIRECSLPAELRCVLRKLNATDVEVVTLNTVLTRLRPELFAGMRAVRALILFGAAVERTVPVEVVKSLPGLRQFRLCGGDLTLLPDQFHGGSALTYLELSTDRIQELPENAFRGLHDLETLNFWGNSILNTSADALRGLSHLQQLSLNTNKLRHLPSELFSHTPKLKNLSLVRNLLSDLQTGLFQGLEKLEKVEISNDVELKVHPKVFANLPALSTLKLDWCKVLSLPQDLFSNSSSLTTLSMTHNRLGEIPRLLFKDQVSLQVLDLSYNDIREVSAETFVSLKSLQELKLDWNKIEVLPDQLFSGLRKLKSVSMSSNGLKRISSNSFQGASSLQTLVLSRNQLSLLPEWQPAQYYNLEVYSPFNTLLELQHLDLKMNNITKVFDDWRNVLLFLKTLDLSWNQFTGLTSADVQFLSSNIEVDLRHNNISMIYFSRGHGFEPQYQQSTEAVVLLEDNPLVCDCNLYTFMTALRGARTLTAQPEFRVGDTRCTGSEELDGTPISDIGLDQLYCGINCTDTCFCKIRPSTSTLELYCDRISPMPSPPEYGLARNSMKLLDPPPDPSTVPDHLDSMDLSGLNLTELPFDRIPPTLKELDLRNNSLAVVPAVVLRGNLTVMLSGNGIACDCRRADELARLMMNRNRIQDFGNLTCSDGRYVSQVDAGRLCDLHRAAITGTVLLALALIITLLCRYSLEVRVFLYSRGCLTCLPTLDELDEDKEYDVFVSHSHKDEDFVRDELLGRLEPEYRVCVHYRDWVVGDMIPTQIATSVERSRRTVIVLTRDFLESLWAMNEFRAAHALAVKERRVRVIVIVMEDGLNLEEEHEELRAYMTTNTYIKWKDPMFWDRLRYALPHRKGVAQGKGDGGKIKPGGLNVQLNGRGELINAGFKESV